MDVDADVNGWTRTDGGTVNIYIHCPSLALSPKKTLLILSILVTEKLNIFSSARCLLLSAAVSKPDNIAALTTMTILKGSLS